MNNPVESNYKCAMFVQNQKLKSLNGWYFFNDVGEMMLFLEDNFVSLNKDINYRSIKFYDLTYHEYDNYSSKPIFSFLDAVMNKKKKDSEIPLPA